MWFKCKHCELLREQVKYLQTMVDNLLVAKGVAPIVGKQEEVILEDTEDEKAERARIQKGQVRYGD